MLISEFFDHGGGGAGVKPAIPVAKAVVMERK